MHRLNESTGNAMKTNVFGFSIVLKAVYGITDTNWLRGTIMNRSLSTEKAPAAIGPYSQGVCCGQTVFLSGQLGLDPVFGNLAQGVQEQARQALANIKVLLESVGFALGDVVKTTVFLKNLDDFAAMNTVYAETFEAPYPARSTVEVARLPKDALVEIDVVAVKS